MKVLAWGIAGALCIAVVACSSAGGDTPDIVARTTTTTSGGLGAGGNGGSGVATTGNGGDPSSGNGGNPSSGNGGAGGEVSDGGLDASDGATFDCNVLGEPGNCEVVTDCTLMTEHAPWPGFCPGEADVQCCIPDLLLLCDPSKIALPNVGHTIEAPGVGGCPDGMLPVTTFCVDEYEASLVRVADGTSWSPFENPGMTAVRAVSVAGAVPQGYIDQVEAGVACMNAGKRLCTDTEWLRACQGPNGMTYPYGDMKELGVCNDHRDLHPAYEYFGTTDSSVFSMLDNACINQSPETVDPSGANAGCITAEGAFDMMGNLHEWTADPAGTFRGGYYVDTVENGPGCLYATTAHDTSYWDYSTGFRCCADP